MQFWPEHSLVPMPLILTRLHDLRGYTNYVRVHRGMTHSLPALFIWPIVLSLPLAAMFGVWEHLFSLYLWTFVSCCFPCVSRFVLMYMAFSVSGHFLQKWIHLDTLCLYDPFLFVLHARWRTHLVIRLAWRWRAVISGRCSRLIYAATFFYIAIRASQRKRFMKLGEKGTESCKWDMSSYSESKLVSLAIRLESETSFYLGEIRNGTS